MASASQSGVYDHSMFSRRHYNPIHKLEKKTKDADGAEFLFQPFSHQMQIRTRSAIVQDSKFRCHSTNKKADGESRGRPSSLPGPDRVRLIRKYGRRVKLATKITKLRSESSAGKPTTDTHSLLPTVKLLQPSDREAAIHRADQLLPEKADLVYSRPTTPVAPERVVSGVDCSRVIQTCDKVYYNDIIRRQLHMQDIKGHLPQSTPQPFLWEPETLSPGNPIKPKKRVITVGYQIQFPHAQKCFTDSEEILLHGHNVPGMPTPSAASIKVLPDERRSGNGKKTARSQSYKNNYTVPRKRSTEVDAESLPRLIQTSRCAIVTDSTVPYQKLNCEERGKQPERETPRNNRSRNTSPSFGESPA